jgi:hypothetical protein
MSYEFTYRKNNIKQYITMYKNVHSKDYSNGKIYIIRNNINESTHIGCTTQTLSQRMAQHRSHINAKKKLTNLSTLMRELGTENCYIELI